MNDFDKAFANVIGVEGGYSNNSADNGGETKYGISKRVYPDVDIAALSLEDAKKIYWHDYWMPLNADRLSSALAEYLFDYAVNSGVGTAAKALQRAVGAQPDGKIGPKTLALVNDRDPLQIVRLMFVERALLFANHEDLKEFGHGWFGRLFDVTARYFKEN